MRLFVLSAQWKYNAWNVNSCYWYKISMQGGVFILFQSENSMFEIPWTKKSSWNEQMLNQPILPRVSCCQNCDIGKERS